MATIYDIAKEAGVSAATVSRVLAGSNHPVKEETRQRIEKLAQELGYRPNTIAKSLTKKTTQTIALLVPNITNFFYTQIADEICDFLSQKGYSVFLCNTRRQIEKESQHVETLIARRVDGVIFSSTRTKPEDNIINQENINKLKKYGISTVAFGSHFKNTSQIHINTYKGAFDATEHLIELGHKRIGFIDGLAVGTRQRRRQGWRDALTAHNLPSGEELVTAGDLEVQGGREATAKLWELADPPTALVVANHLMALGAIGELKGRGLEIGGDVSIVGFDDSELSGLMDPPLTVVRQPVQEVAQAAGQLLLAQLEGNKEEELRELETKLIIRASTARKIEE